MKPKPLPLHVLSPEELIVETDCADMLGKEVYTKLNGGMCKVRITGARHVCCELAYTVTLLTECVCQNDTGAIIPAGTDTWIFKSMLVRPH